MSCTPGSSLLMVLFISNTLRDSMNCTSFLWPKFLTSKSGYRLISRFPKVPEKIQPSSSEHSATKVFIARIILSLSAPDSPVLAVLFALASGTAAAALELGFGFFAELLTGCFSSAFCSEYNISR